jgi:diketogulonate reductase-like aldo/keto reductase
MRHFYVRAIAAKQTKQPDKVIDAAMIQAVALAWTIRSGKIIAIPESGSAAHVRENALALSLILTQQELETLDAAHPLR